MSLQKEKEYKKLLAESLSLHDRQAVDGVPWPWTLITVSVANALNFIFLDNN